MFIKDGIVYAGRLTDDIKVIDAKPLTGRMMLVSFSTGEKRLFDTTKLEGGAFADLDDEEAFGNPSLFHGIITWKDGEIDIAPEYVYEESYPYDENVIV